MSYAGRLAIFIRLFTFTASSAVLAAQDLKKHLSLGGFLGHGFYIIQRLHDWIMRSLEAQAMKPVTLGRMPGTDAAQSQHRTSTTNDQNLHLTSHTNPSEEKDICPMNAAKQAEPVECNSSFPRDERELSQLQNSVDDEVLSSCSSIQEKDGEEMEKDQKLTVPTVVSFPKKKSPKKTVSINENVEIYPIKKKKKTSMERLPSREDGDQVSKPVKPILKVASKLKDKLHST